MPIVPGHFTLTPEQRLFKNMLNEYPRLVGYWDFQNRNCDIEGIEKAMGVLSEGENIMARFFVSVWLGEDRSNLSFNFIDAVKSLDTPELNVIRTWLANPVFP